MRIGVLGCGSIGRRHIGNLIALGVPASDIWAYDPDEARQRRATNDFRLSVSETQLAEVVLICSPPQFHVEQAMQAIERGSGVFVEKPLSHDMAGLEELADLVESSYFVNMVACNWRFDERMQRIKQLVDQSARHWNSAELRYESYLPAWRPGIDWRSQFSASAEYGGVLREVGFHWVDLATWLFPGAKLQSATVVKATDLGLDCDGTASLHLGWREGLELSIRVSFEVQPASTYIALHSEIDRVEWSSWGPGMIDDRAYVGELCHFLDCVKAGQPTCNPIRHAIEVQKIIMEALACLK